LGTAFAQYKRSFKGGGLSPAKAKEMLRDGTAHKKPLTKNQIRYFQAIAHGWHPSKQFGGPQQDSLALNTASRNSIQYFNDVVQPKLQANPNDKKAMMDWYNYLARVQDYTNKPYARLTKLNKEEPNKNAPLYNFPYKDWMGNQMNVYNYPAPVGKYQKGDGLSRARDYGSSKKPYPSVASSDFAGPHRSYPIPTRADAVDALRLAHLHGRSDVISKVHQKYPGLKTGGTLALYGQATINPYLSAFQQGGQFNVMNFLFGGDDTEDDILDAQESAPNDTTDNSTSQVAQNEMNRQAQNNDDIDQYNMAMMEAMDNTDSDVNPYADGSGTVALGAGMAGYGFTGSIKDQSGFQTFATPEQGMQAAVNQLRLYQTGRTRNVVPGTNTRINGNTTLLDATRAWAPESDGNNPRAYATFVAKRLGVSTNTPISQIDPKQWARAIAIVEGNKYGNNPGNLRKIR
jgi:hypothetical protein